MRWIYPFVVFAVTAGAFAQPSRTISRPVHTLLPDEGPFSNRLGTTSLGLSGHSLLANSSDNTNGVAGYESPAPMHLFDAHTGEQTAEIRVRDLNGVSQRFGSTLAIDGDLAMVSPANAATAYDMPAGGVYLLDLNTQGIVGALIPEFDPDDLGGRFGYRFALKGNTAVLASNGDHAGYDGRVVVFDVDTRQLRVDLGEFRTSSSGTPVLATNGDYIVLSIPKAFTASTPARVHVFNADGTPHWDLTRGRYYGESLATDGDLLAIGSTIMKVDGVFAGVVEIYRLSTGEFLGSLTQPAPQQRSYFGAQLAMHGTTLVVGAPDRAIDGVGAQGTAYVFDLETMTLTQELAYEPGRDQLRFGSRLGINEHHIAVAFGAPQSGSPNYYHMGGVMIYDRTGGAPPRYARAHYEYLGDRFGVGLAVTGSTVLIGDREPKSGLFGTGGNVYAFDAATGEQTGKIESELGYILQAFGAVIDADESTVVVTAPESPGAGYGVIEGVAYTFDAATGEQISDFVWSERTGFSNFGIAAAVHQGTVAISEIPGDFSFGVPRFTLDPKVNLFTTEGRRLGTLRPPFQHKSTNSLFGYSVDQHEQRTLIGDPGELPGGAAYLYEQATGTLTRLQGSPQTDYRKAGFGVRTDGRLVAVGAPGDRTHGTGVGAVDLYDAGTLEYLESVFPSDPTATMRFGTEIVLTDRYLAVGAPGQGVPALNSGVVYVFDAGSRREIARILPPEASDDLAFGENIAILNNLVFISAERADHQGTDSGAVYVYNLCAPDLNNDGVLENGDIIAFVDLFLSGDLVADLTGDGVVDSGDIGAFLAAYLAGC